MNMIIYTMENHQYALFLCVNQDNPYRSQYEEKKCISLNCGRVVIMRKYEFRYLYRPSSLHIHANSFSSQCKKGGKGLNSIHSRVAQMQNFVLKQAAFLS